jgi:hypothetical protein
MAPFAGAPAGDKEECLHAPTETVKAPDQGLSPWRSEISEERRLQRNMRAAQTLHSQGDDIQTTARNRSRHGQLTEHLRLNAGMSRRRRRRCVTAPATLQYHPRPLRAAAARRVFAGHLLWPPGWSNRRWAWLQLLWLAVQSWSPAPGPGSLSATARLTRRPPTGAFPPNTRPRQSHPGTSSRESAAPRTDLLRAKPSQACTRQRYRSFEARSWTRRDSTFLVRFRLGHRCCMWGLAKTRLVSLFGLAQTRLTASSADH